MCTAVGALLCPQPQMTIVVVLLEPSAGSSVRKALLRLAGTLAGTLAGFAILYFVVLCNGLGHANHPQACSGALCSIVSMCHQLTI